MVKRLIFLWCIIIFLSSCSNTQNNPLLGDFKETPCEGAKCNSGSNLPNPSFARNDNSDIILSKLENTLELSGSCDIKTYTDSEIEITITPQLGAATKLATGFMPIIGITTSGTTQQKPVAKCEKGRWAVALNACQNGIETVGVHRLDLALKGKDANGRLADISDGKIVANINRTELCLFP